MAFPPEQPIYEDPAPPEPPAPAFEPPAAPRAAIVLGPIIIQSAITPLVGLAMLVVGLLAGYFLRPMVSLPFAAAEPTAAEPARASVAATVPAQAAPSNGQPTLLQVVAAGTRHFKGDPNAPVTIIEFSDFQ